MEPLKAVIVIGASAGGLKAVSELLSKAPANLNTAIFIVLHVGRNSVGPILVNHIQKSTSLTCQLAEDNMVIVKGQVYIAPPDYHLMLKGGGIMRVNKGAHENRWRPSIDVLFRSAAAIYSSRTIGIILTGMLDDGTSGMSAIKRSGGICIVQEPSEAEFEDMPVNVINNVKIDYRVPVAEMGYVLMDIFSKPANQQVMIPEDVKIEAAINERMTSNMEELEKIGSRSNFSCPDCGGGLWEVENDAIVRYRCYTGHVYTQKILFEKQANELEESLWIAIRMLEERKNMLKLMARRNQATGRNELEADNNQKAESIGIHIERLKDLMISLDRSGPETSGYA